MQFSPRFASVLDWIPLTAEFFGRGGGGGGGGGGLVGGSQRDMLDSDLFVGEIQTPLRVLSLASSPR